MTLPTDCHVRIFWGFKELIEGIITTKELPEDFIWVTMEDVAPGETPG